MTTVTLVEMAPRDGLQNEKVQVPAAQKIRLIDLLSAAGFARIEATGFVSPKWVPQMGDAAEVMAGITRRVDVRYAALTPNMRGFDAALAAQVDEVAIFASASETFSEKNINCSIADSFDRFAPIMARANEVGMPVRGYVSCVTDCPYEGEVPPEAVVAVAARLSQMGCFEVSLGDTIGKGQPERVAKMLSAVIEHVPATQLAGHFHDTHGVALENIRVGLDHGLRVFDAAAGGLGGCPYAPGAAGNVATEAVVEMLHAAGYATGIDPEALAHAAAFARSLRHPEG
ncbi:MAG: hydroxymethylglutaryl-CoA lyase [Pseudomonadota bacterium]